MSDVGAGHIAGEQHGIRIVRTDCWIKHRAAATGTDHAEAAWPFGSSTGQAHYDGNSEKKKDTEFH